MGKRKKIEEAERQIKPPSSAKQGALAGFFSLFSGVAADAASYAARFESAALFAASKTGSKRLVGWIEDYFRPQKACERKGALQDSKQGMLGEVGNFAGVGANFLIYYFFLSIAAFAVGLLAIRLGIAEDFMGQGGLLQYAITALVITPIATSAWMLFALVILFLCSKALGGKAGLAGQSYPLSQIFCGNGMLMFVFVMIFLAISPLVEVASGMSILHVILMLALFISMLSLLFIMVCLSLYSLYGYYVAIRVTNGFSRFKAIFTMIGFVAMVLLLNLILSKLGL